MKVRAALLALVLSGGSALAQPACTNPGSATNPCYDAATSPQATDIVQGTQATGPKRSNQTVKFQLQQITGGGFPGTFSPLNVTGGGSLAGTFTGNHTYSGNLTFQGTSALNGTTTIGTSSVAATTSLNGPAGAQRIMQWSTAGSSRWRFLTNSTAEGGSNAGSDLQLFSFSDAGASLGSQLLVTRSNGNWNWNNNKTFTNANYTFNGSIVIPGSTYGNSIALMPSGTWTIPAGSGFTVTNNPMYMNTNITSGGVVTPSVSPGLIYLNIPSDTIQFDDATTANQIGDIEIHHTTGGGLFQGQREGIGLQINQAAAANSTSTIIPSILGLHITTEITTSDAGANSSPIPNSGSLEGADFVVLSSPANTHSAMNMAGVEVDVQNQGSVAPTFHYAFLGYSGAGDGSNSSLASGTLGDAAFHTAAGVSATVGDAMGWLCQFCVGKRGTPYPGQPSGTVFGIVPWKGQDGLTGFTSGTTTKKNSPQVTNIFDFSRVLANGGGNGTGRALAVPHFSVDDQGVTQIDSLTFSPVAAGETIDTTLYKLATISGVGATTNKAFVGDRAWEETCKVRGFVKVTAVNGSNAVTAADLSDNTPSYCASNPATLTFYTDGGASFVLNVTWTAPNAQTVQIGATSAGVIVGTGSALATNATTGFLQVPTMAGAPSGTVGAAGKAALVIDTTNKKLCWNAGGGWECSGAFLP